eukprot:364470-Chlamydomonas_euryale.AAC.1
MAALATSIHVLLLPLKRQSPRGFEAEFRILPLQQPKMCMPRIWCVRTASIYSHTYVPKHALQSDWMDWTEHTDGSHGQCCPERSVPPPRVVRSGG